MADTKTMLKDMASIAIRAKSDAKAHTIAMFKIGVRLNTTPSSLSIRQIATYTGLPAPEISMSKKVAKKHDNDLPSFLDACTNVYKTYAWSTIKRKQGKVKDISTHRVRNALHDLRTLIKTGALSEEERKAVLPDVMSIVRFAERYLIPERQLTDINFLKYNECACCGAYPPPENGYQLKTYDSVWQLPILYPCCDACTEEEPDPHRLVVMYATYADKIERAFESIL